MEIEEPMTPDAFLKSLVEATPTEDAEIAIVALASVVLAMAIGPEELYPPHVRNAAQTVLLRQPTDLNINAVMNVASIARGME